MALQQDLIIRGESIQHVYDWFVAGAFLVNRKYQRKLVWTLEEKVMFINSIVSQYSVPLFLLANVNRKGNNYYEIIDGMQRLDAIFSFINGEFYITIDGETGYFDLETMAKTNELLDNRILFQNKPVLKRTICANVANYQLPFSVTNFEDFHVEEIFRRINSNGKKLSDQDLRQAGALGAFPDLVREISSTIRRDTSPGDVVELSKMREISLSNRQLNYGIYLFNVYWVKQNIITMQNMRVSRDEELIAYILIYILLGPNINPSAKKLDIIYSHTYESKNDLLDRINFQIEKYGQKKIVNSFLRVFGEFENISNLSDQSFNKLLFGDSAKAIARSFQVIFLSFYNLITNGMKISNYDNLIKKLDGLGTRLLSDVSSDSWNATFRHELILAIQGVIKDCFEVIDSQDPSTDNWISKLENLLMQSKIEQQLFDFKIGLHDLDTNADFNEDCLNKIIKTLTAIANNGTNIKGYVIVGVADSKEDKDAFQRFHSQEAIEFNGFYITGVQAEVEKKYKNMGIYFNKVKQLIEKQPIEEYTKSFILRNMRLVDYFNKSLLVFVIESTSHPLLYQGKFYERNGANLKNIEPETYRLLFDRFK